MKLFGAFPGATLDQAMVHEAAVRAIAEDRGPADITTMASVPGERSAKARIVAREAGVLAGLPVAAAVFNELDPSLKVIATLQDGQSFKVNDVVLEVSGGVSAILTGERPALNFLQQLSGVATQTAEFVKAVAGTKTKIQDTRKTIPGLRHLQKYAVKCGGGENHRFGLYDRFLFKDNHLNLLKETKDFTAVVATARRLSPEAKIEVEADTLDQVREFAGLGVDTILLDNMTTETMREAVKIINGRALTEASGNMTLERVKEVAQTGVDFISIGRLTHTVRAIDLSLEIE